MNMCSEQNLIIKMLWQLYGSIYFMKGKLILLLPALGVCVCTWLREYVWYCVVAETLQKTIEIFFSP